MQVGGGFPIDTRGKYTLDDCLITSLDEADFLNWEIFRKIRMI